MVHDGKRHPLALDLMTKIISLTVVFKPILWLMYFFNFLDRNAMINGRLNDLEVHLNLKGSQYNTCVSILFVGYLCGQVPSNMILNRVRPSWYMAGKQ